MDGLEDFKLYTAYAGLGNQDAPEEVLKQIERLAKHLESLGYTVRTSGGQGPEEYFERVEAKEVFIPWKNFNGRQSKLSRNANEALDVVKRLSPSFDTLKPAVQAIIAVKAHVILGKDLKSPIKFLVVWSQDGAETAKECTAKTGFVSTAIKLADGLKIPVFNLKRPDALERIKARLEF
jgi:hypothetical protein